jgi:anti-sigma-K factor RskA
MTEEHVLDLLPGYALGCLDDADLLTVTRHLAHCDMCSKKFVIYRETVDQLAMIEPFYTPAPDLKQKVLQRINQKVQQRDFSQQPAKVKPSLMETFRAVLFNPFGWALGGVALLLIIILSINNVLLGQQVNDLQARLPGDNVHLVKLIGAEDTPRTVGYLMVFKNELYGSLIVENAQILDPQHQYQLWLIRDGKRTNGGVFSVNEAGYGVMKVIVDQPLENFHSFGITIEPSGGSIDPTGKKVLGGSS